MAAAAADIGRELAALEAAGVPLVPRRYPLVVPGRAAEPFDPAADWPRRPPRQPTCTCVDPPPG